MPLGEAAAAVTLINGVLRLLSTARALFGAARGTWTRARHQRFATPRALQRALVRREAEIGDTVEVEGYLSRYAHLYRPISFLNARLDVERMASDTARLSRQGKQVVMTAAWLAAQNPIASLPPFTLGDRPIRCLFLYPSSHDSFLYHEAADKEDELHSLRLPRVYEPRVAIPGDAWPIPLLMCADESLMVAERKITLVATIRELPHALAERFARLYSTHYDRRVLSNFLLLPLDPSPSICLSALPEDKDTGVREKKTLSAADRSVLYVEGHVEGAGDSHVVDLMGQALPLDPRAGPVTVGNQGNVRVAVGPKPESGREEYRMLAAREDISVMIKAPNIIGFYGETTPTRDLMRRTSDLAELVSAFRAQLTHVAEERGLPLSLSIDFLYDFERQPLFEPGGILSSEAALRALRGDEELEKAREWLRS
jgi:hypothetical protein